MIFLFGLELEVARLSRRQFGMAGASCLEVLSGVLP